jgi:hypothetical protein
MKLSGSVGAGMEHLGFVINVLVSGSSLLALLRCLRDYSAVDDRGRVRELLDGCSSIVTISWLLSHSHCWMATRPLSLLASCLLMVTVRWFHAHSHC